MIRYAAIMMGGAAGAALRFYLGSLVLRFYPGRFPLGTLVINVSGSFFIGLLMTLFVERMSWGQNWRLFLVTGLLGGYTTFSSFEWETLLTVRSGNMLSAVLYAVASVVLGFGGVWLGAVLAGRR